MASKVQICNMALSRLGATTISSLTDNTPEAKLCNTIFDTLAKRTMVQGSWATTIKRVALAQTSNTPAFGYSYEYQLPVDPLCLKVLNINEDSPVTPYSIEGDKLLIDDSTVKIRYIGYLTDPEDYGPLLTEAIEINLAAYLAMPITGDKNLSISLREEYMAVLMNNLAIDGQQGSKQEVIADDLIEDR